MPEISLAGLLVVAAVAFGAPLVLDLAGLRRIPAVVVEILGGILVGPAVLGWVAIDEVISTLAVIGLAFLLFLAGLEVDVRHLRGPRLASALGGYGLSLVLAGGVALAFASVGLVEAPLIVAIALVATSLGVVIAVLKDLGLATEPFGQLVIAGASIADVAAILLLALALSGDGSGPVATLILLGSFVVVAGLLAVAILGAERSERLAGGLVRLQDSSARIRVRGAFVLLVAFAVIAQRLGLEVILGAFMAGAVLALVDRDERMTHPDFHGRLESVGFGVFIPIFFVSSGVAFDLGALVASPAALVSVPVFVAALLVARGLPALVYRGTLRGREIAAAGLLQATSLPFIVAATGIGVETGQLSASTAAGLVTAGLLSVLAFPAIAETLLTGGLAQSAGRAAGDSPAALPG